MFSAVCADCGDECKVPFRPTSDKPVFCSNCFGGKKNSGGNAGGKDKFEELNAKLDKILGLLSSDSAKATPDKPVEATVDVIAEIAAKQVKKAAKKKAKVKEMAPVTEIVTEE